MPPAPGVPINGATVRALRLANGEKSGQFAARVRISTPYLSNIEAGRKRRVATDVRRRIADGLGCPLAAISGLPESVE